MKLKFDRIGTIGLFLTAIVSPCCFPIFGIGMTALGFGSFELFGGWTQWIFQGLVLVSLIGTVRSYRQQKNILPLATGLISAGLIFYAFHLDISDNWQLKIYIGMFGLLASAGLNEYIQLRPKIICTTCIVIDGKTVELQSTITCPNCGHRKNETMPTDACQFFYECEKCVTVLKPKQGDCCVYCSYGTVKCPSIQAGTNCC
jgi:hypothetical protein